MKLFWSFTNLALYSYFAKIIHKWSDEGETSHLNYNEINDKLFILGYLIYWL